MSRRRFLAKPLAPLLPHAETRTCRQSAASRWCSRRALCKSQRLAPAHQLMHRGRLPHARWPHQQHAPRRAAGEQVVHPFKDGIDLVCGGCGRIAQNGADFFNNRLLLFRLLIQCIFRELPGGLLLDDECELLGGDRRWPASSPGDTANRSTKLAEVRGECVLQSASEARPASSR